MPFPHFLSGLCVLLLSANLLASEFLKNGVTAHRGSSLAFPENTLTSIATGIREGADWVEVDLHLSHDGELLLCHDANTQQVAEHSLTLAATSASALRRLDVAFRFRQRHHLSLEACPPERMPTLDEALDLILAQGKTGLSLQPKAECVAQAIAVIRRRKAEAWVGFNDGSLPKMTQVKELAPELHVFWDRPSHFDLKKDLEIARSLKFESLIFHHAAITESLIREVQAQGFEVGAWTVNDPSQMDQFIAWGIDRLYTDDPKSAHASFAKRLPASARQ